MYPVEFFIKDDFEYSWIACIIYLRNGDIYLAKLPTPDSPEIDGVDDDTLVMFHPARVVATLNEGQVSISLRAFSPLSDDHAVSIPRELITTSMTLRDDHLAAYESYILAQYGEVSGSSPVEPSPETHIENSSVVPFRPKKNLH